MRDTETKKSNLHDVTKLSARLSIKTCNRYGVGGSESDVWEMNLTCNVGFRVKYRPMDMDFWRRHIVGIVGTFW